MVIDTILSELEKDPVLYIPLFLPSGLLLPSIVQKGQQDVPCQSLPLCWRLPTHSLLPIS